MPTERPVYLVGYHDGHGEQRHQQVTYSHVSDQIVSQVVRIRTSLQIMKIMAEFPTTVSTIKRQYANTLLAVAAKDSGITGQYSVVAFGLLAFKKRSLIFLMLLLSWTPCLCVVAIAHLHVYSKLFHCPKELTAIA